jgi:hypothetical protein
MNCINSLIGGILFVYVWKHLHFIFLLLFKIFIYITICIKGFVKLFFVNQIVKKNWHFPLKDENNFKQ